MSDDTNNTTTEPPLSTGEKKEPPFVERDWFLQQLISIANDDGGGMTVTLLVGGSLVSGTLISGKKYFEEFGKVLAGATKPDGSGAEFFTGETKQTIATTYKNLGEKVYAEELPTAALGYAHLRDASIWHGNSSTPAALWRVRISEVGGFMLGAMAR